MRAYSIDLRERIVQAVASGWSPTDVATTFDIGVSTVKRYVTQQRTGGSLAPKTSPGRPRAIPPTDEAALRAQLARSPDATLAEHRAEWLKTHQTAFTISTLSRAIRRLGWTVKKSLSGPESRMHKPARSGTPKF